MIYFVQHGEDGPIKIGYVGKEESFQRRLSLLQIGNPVELHPLGIMDGSQDDERVMHNRFGDFWIKNEWFIPVRVIVSFIEQNTRPVVIHYAKDRKYNIPDDLPEMLNTSDVAKIFEVTTCAVCSWARKGYLDGAARSGIRWIIPRDALLGFKPPKPGGWDQPGRERPKDMQPRGPRPGVEGASDD